MKPIYTKTVTRETVEEKAADVDLIWSEKHTTTRRLFGVVLSVITSDYQCTEREKTSKKGIGFK